MKFQEYLVDKNAPFKRSTKTLLQNKFHSTNNLDIRITSDKSLKKVDFPITQMKNLTIKMGIIIFQ